MAESVTALVTAETETITATVTSGSETFAMEINVAPRGPAGSGGSGGVTSYVADIETLDDYPDSFPAANTDTDPTADTIALRDGEGAITATQFTANDPFNGSDSALVTPAQIGFVVETSTGVFRNFSFVPPSSPAETGADQPIQLPDSAGTLALTSQLGGTSNKLELGATTQYVFIGEIAGAAAFSFGSAAKTAFRTAIGLNNVENTALSTWTGSSHITTIGTLSAFSMSTGAPVTLTGTSQTAWLTALGSSATVSAGKPILWAADASTTLTNLGLGTAGKSIAEAATEAAAQAAIGIKPKTRIRIENDFTSSNLSLHGLTVAAFSSGAFVDVAGVSNHPGILKLRDSTTGNGGYYIMSNPDFLLISGGEKFVCIFQILSSRSTQSVRLGFQDRLLATSPIDGVFIDCIGDGTKWTATAKCRSNNSETASAASGQLDLNTWYSVEIVINDSASSAAFTIYTEAGVSAWTATVSSNLPTGAGRQTGYGVVASESTTDAAADMCQIDYLRFEQIKDLVR